MKVKQHYDDHLAHFYSWMLGEFNTKQKEQQLFFEKHHLLPHQNKLALDLGAGHGLQSVSLAELGFKVIAIDLSEELLKELNVIKKDLDIHTVESDLMNFAAYEMHQPELIVCMGDTLTHLSSVDDVRKLFYKIYSMLLPKGKLVLTFRDLSVELKDEQRFIPVRSDEHRIHTCFLEYADTYVNVYDLLHENENGQWKQKVSFYPKLRLSGSLISGELQKTGFKISLNEVTGNLIQLIAEK